MANTNSWGHFNCEDSIGSVCLLAKTSSLIIPQCLRIASFLYLRPRCLSLAVPVFFIFTVVFLCFFLAFDGVQFGIFHSPSQHLVLLCSCAVDASQFNFVELRRKKSKYMYSHDRNPMKPSFLFTGRQAVRSYTEFQWRRRHCAKKSSVIVVFPNFHSPLYFSSLPKIDVSPIALSANFHYIIFLL